MHQVLTDHEQIDTSISGAVAYRVRYTSQDLRGIPTESTGLVIAPEAPGGDRPVMSWAHGTTGIGDAACPSAQPDPARELTIYFEPGTAAQIDFGIPGLQRWIDDGWVVVATDYQGLGTPGMHQYTVGRTNATDAVTIVHAARELPVGAGHRFGVVGWSQGGGAAAAAVELDDAVYGDLQVVGAACMSPGVPSIGIRQPGLGDALRSGHVPPDPHVFFLLAGLVAAFPDSLSLDDMLTPLGQQVLEQSADTQPVHHFGDTLARMERHVGPTVQVDQSALPRWVDAIDRSGAAQVRPVAPVLVLRDAQVDDGPCPTPWQLGYLQAITDLGGDIVEKVYPDDDHFSLPGSSVDDARAWLTARFAD